MLDLGIPSLFEHSFVIGCHRGGMDFFYAQYSVCKPKTVDVRDDTC
jgi:hypothetical protein